MNDDFGPIGNIIVFGALFLAAVFVFAVEPMIRRRRERRGRAKCPTCLGTGERAAPSPMPDCGRSMVPCECEYGRRRFPDDKPPWDNGDDLAFAPAVCHTLGNALAIFDALVAKVPDPELRAKMRDQVMRLARLRERAQRVARIK